MAELRRLTDEEVQRYRIKAQQNWNGDYCRIRPEPLLALIAEVEQARQRERDVKQKTQEEWERQIDETW